ncbi:MAG: hypothetical protein PUD55_05995 [Firmicutes bacterium]|nr:hypothetical protein [Bacillota bacterium]
MNRLKNLALRIRSSISGKQVLIYFGLMLTLYIFSLFGTMFGSSDFAYSEF